LQSSAFRLTRRRRRCGRRRRVDGSLSELHIRHCFDQRAQRSGNRSSIKAGQPAHHKPRRMHVWRENCRDDADGGRLNRHEDVIGVYANELRGEDLPERLHVEGVHTARDSEGGKDHTPQRLARCKLRWRVRHQGQGGRSWMWGDWRCNQATRGKRCSWRWLQRWQWSGWW
jgi:hypothetical protein